MADNITRGADGRDHIAFRGSRKDIWHRKGTEKDAGASIESWAHDAGLDWEAVLVPAYMCFNGEMRLVEGQKHIARNDNGFELGYATDVFKPVQPIECLYWINDYCEASEGQFELDVAGSLKGGKHVWATAVFKDDIVAGGDRHVARLLMSTTFDCTRATVNQVTFTRVVCDNTLSAAFRDGHKHGGMIKTRHNSKFNGNKVGHDLAEIAKQIEGFKRMADAMAQHHMKKDQISTFFKKCLDIPFDVKPEDVSARKTNQFEELNAAYRATVGEGTEPETAWCALNAVTRYVDHSRGTRDTGHGAVDSQFYSTQLGSGAALKAKAVETLYEMSDGELLKAIASKTEDNSWVNEVLKTPLFRN
jgi:phage/plasmid-like protein (TIGR03299 family)